MKKRILAMLLAGSMIFSLAACSGGSGTAETTPAEPGSADTHTGANDGAKTGQLGPSRLGRGNAQD